MTLVKISDQTWVNPAHVVSVVAYPFQGHVAISTTASAAVTVDFNDGENASDALDRVLALIQQPL